MKIADENWYIVANDQNRTHITYQIKEFIYIFGDGEQDAVKVSDKNQQRNEESKWIDIKGDTNKKTDKQIERMIKCSLFGENKENEESKEFANQFNKLSINQEEKSS